MAASKGSTTKSGAKAGTRAAASGTAKRKSTSSRTASGSRKTSSGRSKSSSAARRTSPSARKPAPGKGRKPVPRSAPPVRSSGGREAGSIICLLLALFAFLGFIPVHALFLDFFRNLLLGLFGLGYYVMPFCLVAGAVVLAFRRKEPAGLRFVCAILFAVLCGALLHVLFCKVDFTGQMSTLYAMGKLGKCGGLFSGAIAIGLSRIISKVGAGIVLVLLLFLTGITVFHITVGQVIQKLQILWQSLIAPEDDYEDEDFDEVEEIVGTEPMGRAVPLPRKKNRRGGDKPDKDAPTEPTDIDIPLDADGESAGDEDGDEEPLDVPNLKKSADKSAQTDGTDGAETAETDGEQSPAADEAATDGEPETDGEEPDGEKPRRGFLVPGLDGEEPDGDEEEAGDALDEVSREAKQAMEATSDYRYPPLSLLTAPAGQARDSGQQEIQTNQERLADTIASFGIDARVVDAVRGPTVTRYEVELDRGVKLNKLTNLSDDIALSLGVSGVRIAPIPDKISVVGIEVPNREVSIVYARDVIGSELFRDHKSKVAFAVGRDIAGTDVVGNIAKLPHMLIAGTTGSGKSVCMNTLIVSLLYKATPDEVRLIMIDPKMIELGVYNGIPHLLIPVVTDPKKAAGALQWAVTEMMKRYRLFSEAGARDMESYNAIVAKDPEHQKLPHIVIVIDELADLMLVAAKDVEESVCRIAQMARAAGMHLIIATQRPSADVITGIMKANIPSRIAFAVASAMESRIILDSQGAEKLIGHGDMLYSPLGAGKPTRVQGCLITSEEVEAVVGFIKESSVAEYSDEIIREIEQNAASAGTKGGGSASAAASGDGETPQDDADELLPAAVEVSLEIGQASASMLQRRLKLGYARAARLIDQMEERGIIGPFEGSKPRQMLITKEQWQAMQMGSGPAAEAGSEWGIAPDPAQLPEEDDI